MPQFSDQSKFLLSECHPILIDLFNEVIKQMDCKVICGFRCEHEQHTAFKNGNTKVDWPNSKHNKIPAMAVDVVPYPVDWNDIEAFKRLGSLVLSIAAKKGYHIRWGGDFNMDGDKTTKDSWDKPHYEIVEKK